MTSCSFSSSGLLQYFSQFCLKNLTILDHGESLSTMHVTLIICQCHSACQCFLCAATIADGPAMPMHVPIQGSNSIATPDPGNMPSNQVRYQMSGQKAEISGTYSHTVPDIPMYLLSIPMYLLSIPMYLLSIPMYLLCIPLYLRDIAMYLLGTPLYLLVIPMYLLIIPLYLLGTPLYLLVIPLSLLGIPMYLLGTPPYLLVIPLSLLGIPMYLLRIPLYLRDIPMYLLRIPLYLLGIPLYLLVKPLSLLGIPLYLLGIPLYLLVKPLSLLGIPLSLLGIPLYLLGILLYLLIIPLYLLRFQDCLFCDSDSAMKVDAAVYQRAGHVTDGHHLSRLDGSQVPGPMKQFDVRQQRQQLHQQLKLPDQQSQHAIVMQTEPHSFRSDSQQQSDSFPVSSTDDLSDLRSEEHTSELQSRPHISYAVFCLKKKKQNKKKKKTNQ